MCAKKQRLSCHDTVTRAKSGSSALVIRLKLFHAVRPSPHEGRGSGFHLVLIAILKPILRQISSTSVKYIHTLLTNRLPERVYSVNDAVRVGGHMTELQVLPSDTAENPARRARAAPFALHRVVKVCWVSLIGKATDRFGELKGSSPFTQLQPFALNSHKGIRAVVWPRPGGFALAHLRRRANPNS
jgi:hypothetical protein